MAPDAIDDVANAIVTVSVVHVQAAELRTFMGDFNPPVYP
tara:strand:- start:97 stop:216 length:120 start_codon:yes stop_codon:yes gene_type:complete